MINNDSEQPTIDQQGHRVYTSTAYVVLVDDHFFVSKDDWTEHPAFAVKYGKPRMANARAEDERQKFPNANIRVAKLHQSFRIVEQ